MKRDLKLVEETKNTNYKMHKSKKNWLVSYSLLTFMLGGIYLDSQVGTPVKAAEIDPQVGQKGVDQNLQQSVEEDSIDSAKQNAAGAIDTAATATKAKINSDQNLSSSDKAIQLNRVDVIVTQAKASVKGANSLADINATLTQATNAIGACYRAGVANTAIKKTKQSTQAAPTVNKSKKPLAKKVSVSTYKGLNSFFKTSETPTIASS
ncbi:DUF1542 domain-containing protein, partial [Lactobacillus apis]|uniref:DUF1542 domain-containing protein n=1 Tax=Lactobacillus apis TaxID=303541 RepID=UPI001662CB99